MIVTLHLVVKNEISLVSTIFARGFNAGISFEEQTFLFRFPPIVRHLFSFVDVTFRVRKHCISFDCMIVVFIHVWNVTRASLCTILFTSRFIDIIDGVPAVPAHLSCTFQKEHRLYYYKNCSDFIVQLRPRYYKTYVYLWNNTLPANTAVYVHFFLHHCIRSLTFFSSLDYCIKNVS